MCYIKKSISSNRTKKVLREDEFVETKIHSIQYNFLMNVILKLSSIIFPLITFPYVSRILEAAGNGKIAFASSAVNYFSLFAMLGIATHGVKVCAQCRDDKTELSRTVQELLILNAAATFAVYVIFLISIMTVPRFQQERILMLIMSASIFLNALGVEWFYQAVEQYRYITIRNLAFKILSVALMFWLVHDPSDYVIYGAITVVGTTGSYILNVVHLRHFVTLKPVGNYHFRRHLKPVLLFFALTVASSIYTNLDTVMLGFLAGNQMTGYYNAAVKIKSVLLSLVTALSGVMVPRMSYYIQSQRLDEFRNMARKAMHITLLMALPCTVYFILEAKAVILFLAGREYLPSVIPMQVIMPTILFIGISQVTGLQVLIPLDKGVYTTLSTVAGAIIDFILNCFLIPGYGAAGAALATLIAETAVAGIQLMVLKTEHIGFFDWANLVKAGGACVCAAAAMVLVENILQHYEFLRLCAAAVVFWGIYGLLLLCFREENIIKYVKGKETLM